MNRLLINLLLWLAVMLTWLAPPSGAALHEQLAVSSRGNAMGNAVTADPPGVMAIHYNPAGLSRLKGSNFTLGVTAAPEIKKTSRFTDDPEHEGFFGYNDDPLAGTEGTTTGGAMALPGIGRVPFLAVPTIGLSHRKPDSRWTFAYGLYAPFGIGIDHSEEDDPAQYGGSTIYSQHLVYAAPSVSYQLTDSLSLGLSVGFGQSALGASVSMRAPNDMVAMTKVLGDATEGLNIPIKSQLGFPGPWFGGGLDPYGKIGTLDLDVEDNFVPSYNLGVLWDPFKWLSIGAVYQSESKATMGGRYEIEYGEEFQRFVNWWGSTPKTLILAGILNLPFQPLDKQQGRAVLEWVNPQRAQLGVALRPLPGLTLTTDLHYTNWAAMKSNVVEFDQSIQALQLANILGYPGNPNQLILKRDFKDDLHLSFGLEWWLFDRIALRAGYEDRPSPVQKNYFDLTLPIADMKIYSGGLGVRITPQLEMDLGFSYVTQKETYKQANNTSDYMNSTNFTKVIYNPYAGLDYEQDLTAYTVSLAFNYSW